MPVAGWGDKVKQIEAHYRGLLDYPALFVDEARTKAGHSGDSEFTYGETPAASLIELMQGAGVKDDDVFYDLGCGLAATVMVASLFCKRANGVELLEPLATTARGAASALGLANVTIHNTDYRNADLSDGTLFYCYATCTTSATRELISERLLATAPGTRIVTVTHNLDHPQLELKDTRDVWWGGGRHGIYLHVRR